MKKLIQLLTLNLFVLMLIASCTGTTGLGFDGGDDDPQDIPDAQTLTTDWSHMQGNEYFQLAMGLEKSEDFAGVFAQLCEEKIMQGKSETWAIAYAARKAAGQSEEDAQAHADNSTQSEVRAEAYKRMITRGKGEEFAQRYAEIYDTLRKNEKSHAFADHYAYQRTKGKSALFATHFAEKMVAGKSQSWAAAYAFAMEKTCLSSFATRMADVYTQKKAQGMRTAEAQQEACRIAAGRNTDDDINSQDENGDTALIRAAQQGDIAQTKTLIGADADCNIRNNEGKTALMIAAVQGDVSIVALLLNANMQGVNVKDGNGKTALTWARKGKAKAGKEMRPQYNSIIRMFEGVAADENGIRRFVQRFVPGYDQAVSAAGVAAAMAVL